MKLAASFASAARRVQKAKCAAGPEAAAREARYEALVAAARSVQAAAVLLGHTREDQAETVLLALARGAGPRGIAGMPAMREIHGMPFLRPFLDVPRAQTRQACAELGLTPWEDPQNSDPAFSRSRVRAALGLLADLLGPGTVTNLARTAKLVAQDTSALDELAVSAWQASVFGPLGWGAAEQERSETDQAGGLYVPALRELPDALRTRVLRRFALSLGCPPGALASRHIDALDALVTDWHGQKAVALPGGHHVIRHSNRLLPAPRPTPASPQPPNP